MPAYNQVGIGAKFLPYARTVQYVLSGVTKDSTGAALPNCVVDAYETTADQHRGTTISDELGNYAIHVAGVEGENFYARAYLSGAPDVAGTTVNTLTAEAR